MRPNGDGCLPSLKFCASKHTFARAHAPCEQYSADTEWLKHSTDATSVLLGKQFCRGHDRALVAIQGGHKESGGCNSCFPCSNITLQETTHRLTLCNISENFANH